MLQKTSKHYLMLHIFCGNSVEVRLLYVVHSFTQCNLPKEDFRKSETSSTTKAYIVSSKLILFISGRKKKQPQTVDMQYVKVNKNTWDILGIMEEPLSLISEKEANCSTNTQE